MTDMSKKQAEFFSLVIILCTVTAALVLVIDYQIKGAILQQSNSLRLLIEANSGQRPATAGSYRPDNNARNDVPYPADMVDSGNARVETSSPDGASNGQSQAQKIRATRAKRPDGPSTIPDTDIRGES